MKKIYFLLTALTVGTVAVAQQNVSLKRNIEIAPQKTNNTVSYEKVELWANDFSDASEWTFSANGGTSDNWVIGTGVPSGDYPIAGINSTTAANGFALFDSDLMCSASQNADVYFSAPIDLTGYSDVQLSFESYYRRYQGNCYVIASTDGINWTQIQVHTTIASNASTANPQVTFANISSIVGNSATAYIGFRYIGACDYAWMVDDVKIVTVEDYDLEAVGLHWGSEGAWGPRMPYYQIPNDQITEINFAGVVNNIGVQNVTDVTFSVSNGYTGASAPGSLNAGAIDTFQVANSFTPSANTDYTFDFAVATPGNVEPNLGNNTFTSASISVNENVYARDLGTILGGSFNQGIGYEMGNIYDIYTAADLHAIDVVIHNNTVVGTQIFAKLYAPSAETLDVYVGESDMYEVTAADLGNKVTLTLMDGPFPLDAGASYLVVVGTFGSGGANDDLVVGSSGQSSPSAQAQNSYFFDAADDTWYYLTSTPMVRMNFDATISVNNVASLEGVKVYPNPSTGLVNVSNDLNVENTIVVTDLSGKVVTSKVASVATTIDLNTVGTGVYFVEVSNKNGKKVERVVIK